MWYFYSSIQAVFDLKRTCRKCGTSTVVKLADKSRPTTCGRCGTSMPPTT